MRIRVDARGDAARAPMLAAWLRALTSDRVAVEFAHADAAGPDVVAVMAEVGVDLRRPSPAFAEPGEGARRVVVGAAEPGALAFDAPDPASAADRPAALRSARDRLGDAVAEWAAAEGLAPPFGAAIRPAFELDPEVTFLNHGSFGATPREVLDARDALSREFEREPVQYVVHTQPRAMRAAAARVGAFLGVPAEELVFVDNASAGANAVVRSLDLGPGDVVLTTDHTYLAVRRLLDWVAARTGARIHVAPVPFPLGSPEDVVDAVRAGFPERVKLAVFDHVTSPTGLLFPVAALAALCRERDVPVFVDGAHAPGMVVADLEAIGADFWTGNLHKWAFAPKGCAVLHVRSPWHAKIRPPVISNAPTGTALWDEFDYQGTRDPSVFLAAEAGLAWGDRLGWDRIRAHNHRLRAGVGAAWLARTGLPAAAPEGLLAGLQTLPLPDRLAAKTGDELNRRLFEDHRIEAMFPRFSGRTWFRTSPQVYNDAAQYLRLAAALDALA